MKAIDSVGVTFVSLVLGQGAFNGVVNLTLGVLPFAPKDDGTVDYDPVVAARLRMDIPCARNLHEVLGNLLASIDAAKAANGAGAHDETPPETAKPN